MARGINKVILVGNVGRDPEIRHQPSGGAVANLSMATSESWKDKQSGQQQERTEWHRVVFFGRQAEIVRDYVKKGDRLYVEGKLQTRKWQKDGVDRYTTEIHGRELQMLGGGRGGNGQHGGQQGAGGGQGGQYQPQHSPANSGQPAPSGGGGFDDFDDDIPF